MLVDVLVDNFNVLVGMCLTKFGVGGCVGGYLPLHPFNQPRCSCICRYNTKVNFTLSVNLYRQNLVRDSQIVQNDWYHSENK